MDEATQSGIEPLTEAARQCRWCVTAQDPDTVEIGGMWFTENQPSLHKTCRAILEDGAEPQRVYDIGNLLTDRIQLAAEVSESPSHSFSGEPFLPYEARPMVELLSLLSKGRAQVRRSQITGTRDDPEHSWDLLHGLGVDDLSDQDRQTLGMLKERRGRVGEPLEVFWQISCHLGLARDAETICRSYGSGHIPKLKIDNHLFQIERKPLRQQIEQAISSDCSGLAWVMDEYIDGATLVLEFEALTFDAPDEVKSLIQKFHAERMKEVHEALSHVDRETFPDGFPDNLRWSFD